MPYPNDPFALTIPTAYICPTANCGGRLTLFTKDPTSVYLGSVKCGKCGYTGDAEKSRKDFRNSRTNKLKPS